MAPKAKTPATKKPAAKKPAKAVPRIAGLNAPEPKARKAKKAAAPKVAKVAGLTARAPKTHLKGQRIVVAWQEVKPQLRAGSVPYITAAAFQGNGRQYESGIEAVLSHFKAAKTPVERNDVQVALAKLVRNKLAKVA